MGDLRRFFGFLIGVSLVLASAAGAGTISGKVRSLVSGQSVAAHVQILDANGAFLDSFVTEDGSYSFSGLAAGGYHLVASAEDMALRFWPDVNCYTGSICALGQVVNVDAGGTATADFSLDTLGVISGRVVDAETGAPVGGGRITGLFRSPSAQGLDGAPVDAGGYFRMTGLSPGSWTLVSTNNPVHIERIYGGDDCEVDCDYWSIEGTVIEAQLNQGKALASDLQLSFGPGLAGWASREGTVAAGLAVDIFDDGGTHVATVTTDAAGHFRQAMPEGTYYLATDNGPGFVDQVFREHPCPDGPASEGLCDPLDGDPVLVSAGAPAADNIAFDLAAPSSLFRDGFESGDFTGWSLVTGN